MAVTQQSKTDPTIQTNQTSIVVTKPTGLAVGDLMVAFLAILDGASTIDVTSGWTDCGQGEVNISASGSTMRARVLYKIADSGDAGATNFTFTLTGGTTDFVGGAIHRVSGQNPNTVIDKYYGAGRSDDNDIIEGDYPANLTPTYASELYYMFICGTGMSSISTHALITDNPTWTEDYDTVSTLLMNAAHATRTAVTSTGSATFAQSGGTGANDSILFLIIIKDLVNVTVSPSVINATSAVLTPTMTGGATVSPSVINATGAVLTPAHNNQADWSAKDKSDTATWTNQSKS